MNDSGHHDTIVISATVYGRTLIKINERMGKKFCRTARDIIKRCEGNMKDLFLIYFPVKLYLLIKIIYAH